MNGECGDVPLRPCPIHLLFNSEEGYGCQVCLNPQFLSHCDDEPVELEWVYRHEEGMPYSICCEAKFRCGENTHTRAGTCTNTCHPPEGEPGDPEDPDDPEDPEEGDKCGPDVKKALVPLLDKVGSLAAFLAIRAPARFHRACRAIDPIWKPGDVDGLVAHWSHAVYDAWDIGELRFGGVHTVSPQCPTGACNGTRESTVGVNEACFTSASVNYVLFGLLGRLCGYSLAWVKTWASTTFLKVLFLLHTPSAASSALNWAEAGWNVYPHGAGEPAADRGDCSRCRGGSLPPGDLSATWDGMDIW